MEANVVADTLTTALEESFSAADEELYLINPTYETIEELVDVLDADSPTVRLLAPEETLKTVTDDFLVASAAADHVEAGTLEFRAAETDANTLVVTDLTVVALVDGGDSAAGLTTTDETFVDAAHGRFDGAWDDAEAFDLRTPALSRVRSSLEDELGEATAPDAAGRRYRDPFDDRERAVGTTARATLDRGRLRELFERYSAPVRFDGRLRWTNELVDDLPKR